ncbi:putative transporter [Wickerhamomyces ciferrii]|uniref:Transporter n=1 Tax=Wickerhamomyces ciferrii (strain ATCC 14091 / BCRC 22168 / CBS 111 / JCM 3599 / NBRC 0793 / NRRL Y-1031 F-60-10) TaxID=1206466 RepID=K0K953_WICCF|nr:putative transporter [Wickerhamomyces ciferrii]CCH41420.1 putative transporter [Wickerhamomyces ciferrii]
MSDSTTNTQPLQKEHSNESSISQAEVPQQLNQNDIEAQKVENDGYGDELSRTESNNTEASRQLSRALTGADDIQEQLSKQKTPLPPMGLNKEIPTDYPDREPYTVSYNGPDDPLHPHNWPLKKKIMTCAIIGYCTGCVAWGSSIFSSATLVVSAKYNVGLTVSTLGTSLFVLGFALGPVVYGPLSELYGRRSVMLISLLGFTLFQFAVATAENLQTILICRAFGGMIGAAPLVVVPASFADLFGPQSRGKAITIFSMTVFCLPIIAPVAGSFIVNSYLGWRWTEYITGIMIAAGLVVACVFYEETHHPVILSYKARELKNRTGNWLIHAPHDEFQLSIKDIVEKNINRPLKMLITEPILLLISLYNAFIYGILYLLLSAYPIIFAEGYRMKGGVAELPYLGVAIGMVTGGCFCYLMEGKYLKAMANNGGKPVPEARLFPMFGGAIAFPVGIFWLTWTGNYHEKVHWMAPTASGVFTGFGLITIFNASINYLIDSYLIFAASALAANAFLRAAFACAFPLFATQMFHNLGTNWAGLLLACVGFALLPVPFLFYRFGKRIRGKSKFAFVLS